MVIFMWWGERTREPYSGQWIKVKTALSRERWRLVGATKLK
jgi:hypothetical protein